MANHSNAASARPLKLARARRRGSVLIYATLMMTAVLGFASLAVDYGRVQTIKSEMQTSADATALAVMNSYAETYSTTSAGAAGAAMAAYNPIDRGSGVSPTVTYTGGTWDSVARTFSPTYAPGTPAVRVTISRSSAAGNAVPLMLGKLIGMSAVNVQAAATATLVDNDTTSASIPSVANPYFSGMPSGTSSSWGDNTTNAPPYALTGIAVVPGTWITVTNTGGTASILPGTVAAVGPEGEATRPLHHGQNYNNADWGIGSENGIGDAVMPAGALMGVFLTNAAPNATAAPAAVDWTQPAQKNQPSYTNLQTKSPFLIGDGKTTGGVVQKFLVPPGATRMYLSIWDGVTQSNNTGTITATVNLKRSVRLVK